MNQHHFFKFISPVFLPILFTTLLSGCGKLTDKVVNKDSSASDSNQGSGVAPDQLKILSPQPDESGRINSHFFLLTGNCLVTGSEVIVDGDFEGSPFSATCSDSGEFSALIIPKKLYESNSIVVRQSNNNEFNTDNLEFDFFPFGVFCGDNIVNQDFEVCDGGLGCNEFCQTGNNLPANLVLAKVTITATEHSSNALTSPDINLGTADEVIPSGVWFPLSVNGSVIGDQEASSFADEAPGLAVGRSPGSIKFLLSGKFTNGFRHMQGSVEIAGASIDDLDDGVDEESLEAFFDGNAEIDPDQDELSISNGVIQFHMTTSQNSDAFILDWAL